VKVTAALTAAMTLSFTQLIRKAIPLDITNFVVPTEIMVDLRRYMLDKRTQQSFGSVGAVHMPLQVDIDLYLLMSTQTVIFLSLVDFVSLKESALAEPSLVLLWRGPRPTCSDTA
jgi:hypothetical protein